MDDFEVVKISEKEFKIQLKFKHPEEISNKNKLRIGLNTHSKLIVLANREAHIHLVKLDFEQSGGALNTLAKGS